MQLCRRFVDLVSSLSAAPMSHAERPSSSPTHSKSQGTLFPTRTPPRPLTRHASSARVLTGRARPVESRRSLRGAVAGEESKFVGQQQPTRSRVELEVLSPGPGACATAARSCERGTYRCGPRPGSYDLLACTGAFTRDVSSRHPGHPAYSFGTAPRPVSSAIRPGGSPPREGPAGTHRAPSPERDALKGELPLPPEPPLNAIAPSSLKAQAMSTRRTSPRATVPRAPRFGYLGATTTQRVSYIDAEHIDRRNFDSKRKNPAAFSFGTSSRTPLHKQLPSKY